MGSKLTPEKINELFIEAYKDYPNDCDKWWERLKLLIDRHENPWKYAEDWESWFE